MGVLDLMGEWLMLSVSIGGCVTVGGLGLDVGVGLGMSGVLGCV